MTIELEESDPLGWLQAIRSLIRMCGGMERLQAKIRELTKALEREEGAKWIREQVKDEKAADNLAHTVLLCYVLAAGAHRFGGLDEMS